MTLPHFPGALDTVYHVDALALLAALPDASVDCVVTSPPYNMRTQLNGAKASSISDSNWGKSTLLRSGYSDFDDALPHTDYVATQRKVISECMRVLSDTGALFYNHKWRIQGGLLVDRSDIVSNFPVRQIIIWDRGSSNNHNRSFFAPQFEVIYVIAKPKFRIRQDATKWGDVWRINPVVSVDDDHPAPFPLEIPHRCIYASDAEFVVDMYAGSGTTLVAARNLGRRFLGCDLSAEYVATARKRLAQPYTPSFMNLLDAADNAAADDAETRSA